MPRNSKRPMGSLKSPSYFLITGGSGGIGSEICRLLMPIGVIPIVGYNSNELHAENLAQETGGFSVKLDMSDLDSIKMAAQTIEDKIGEDAELLGIVLGASPPPDLLPLTSLTSDQLLNQFKINVMGSHYLISILIKKFFRRAKSGTIIGILTQAISSEHKMPATGMGSYVIAKEALKSMLSVFSAEYAWLKIRTVSPGFTKTEMLKVFDPRYLEIMQEKSVFLKPEEVAEQIINEIIS
jgi:3-oxoacyl-[acyl-carrier protein] reductase